MGWTIASFIISVFLTIGIGYWIYYSGFLPPPDSGSTGNNGTVNPRPAEIPPWELFGTDKLTFILLGYDEVDEFAHRSDTLMIGAVDFIARKVRIVSLPRDTLVYIPRYSFMKVNSAYALGGDDLVRRTVENFTGVQIDYVVSVNYRGFVEVVDALGGVDIEVERAMHYDDNRGFTHIHIDEGFHHMDGETALGYARFRQFEDGDFGRIRRQQELMRALFDQAIKPSNWTRLDNAADAFINRVGVTANPESPRNPPEIELEHVISIIGFLTNLNDDEDLKFYEIPVIDIKWQGLDCLRPIYSQTGLMLAEVFRDDAESGWEPVQ